MARLGLLALGTQYINTLAIGSVLVSVPCFEWYCRLCDGSRFIAGLETLLVFAPGSALLLADYRSLRLTKWQWPWQRSANRVLILTSFAYVALHVAALRGPWLLGNAGATDRLTVWTARLSSTTAGVPLLAFTLALGMGANLWCISAAWLRAARSVPDNPVHFERLAWILCALVVLVGLAAITTFATGGSV